MPLVWCAFRCNEWYTPSLPLVTLSSINVPETYENNFEISFAYYEVQYGVDNETPADENTVIPYMFSYLHKNPLIKRNVEGVLTLKKKPWSTPSPTTCDIRPYRDFSELNKSRDGDTCDA